MKNIALETDKNFSVSLGLEILAPVVEGPERTLWELLDREKSRSWHDYNDPKRDLAAELLKEIKQGAMKTCLDILAHEINLISTNISGRRWEFCHAAPRVVWERSFPPAEKMSLRGKFGTIDVPTDRPIEIFIGGGQTFGSGGSMTSLRAVTGPETEMIPISADNNGFRIMEFGWVRFFPGSVMTAYDGDGIGEGRTFTNCTLVGK